ncbi:MAG: hypothetical protein NDI63_00885 [Pseudobdellovibrio sp.]|nr:hypothetical protein [Pseudobdellovibrio sp.]
MGSTIRSLFTLICGILLVTSKVLAVESLLAGVYPEAKSPIPLFAEDSTLRLELVADFNVFLKLPKSSPTKVPAKLIYFTDTNGQQAIDVKLSLRGESKQTFCQNFRPIRIYFDIQKTDLTLTPFKGISEDVKLATHCQGTGVIKDTDVNVQQILREQTAYKMLEALGFMTLKTRSVRITYKNLDGGVVAEALAFFLEPKSNMAKRYGLKHIKKVKADIIYAPVPENNIAFKLSTRFLMHTDVDSGGEHNTILLVREGESKAVTMVPYDFDLTGMVIDSKYMGTAHAYKQWSLQNWGDDGEWLKKSISGEFISEEYRNQTYTVATYALSHKEAVQQVIDNSPVLDKSLMQERVNTFFSGIERTLSEK